MFYSGNQTFVWYIFYCTEEKDKSKTTGPKFSDFKFRAITSVTNLNVICLQG